MTGQVEKIARGEQTRQRILEAAEQVFAELGYAEARLEDVAQRVGIRRPSLIYYFADKQALYDEVRTHIYQALDTATATRAHRQDDAFARLDTLLDSWLDFMVARPSAARIILRNTVEVRPRIPSVRRSSESALVSFELAVREGQAKGQFDPAADPVLVLMMVGNSILHYVCSGPLLSGGRAYDPADPTQRERYRRMLRQTVRSMLRPPP